MYEKELHEELTKMWDDPDFARGALVFLKTEEQRKDVLNRIRSGELDDATEVIGYVLELAGICEKVK